MDDNTNATLGAETGANGATNEGNQEGQKTYTQEEYEKKLQAETDKRVTEALKTAQTKWQSEYEQKLKREKDEAARLAIMTTEERAKAEREKAEKLFNDEKSKFNRERLEFEVTKQLAEKKLPVSFAKLLCGADADEAKANLEKFEKEYNSAIEAGVTEKLKGTKPKAPTGTSDTWLNSVRQGAGLK